MTWPLATRQAGVLLHPSSLPGEGYSGDFGAEARRFVDLMAQAGLRIWQVLPLGPTHIDMCPYQSFSVHAGNPDFVDLYALAERGWISAADAAQGTLDPQAKRRILDVASVAFYRQLRAEPDSAVAVAFQNFLQQSDYWLEDYARFHAFRSAHGLSAWTEWPQDLRRRDVAACDALAHQLSEHIGRIRFRQFVVHHQWRELREYARQRGVLLFGDMPIYLHLDSADVWAHQSLFDLDDDSRPITVTGVPPDYFSAQGQLWGNPQYNWQLMRHTGFTWWLQRFATAQQQFDILRIDHFRALEAYWEIPASATTAMQGKWVPAPGRELLQAVQQRFPALCLVAENLGTISAEVETLRRDFSLPGMVILQFAFDGNPDNPYLSHRHSQGDIVYTGTHDNNTTLGWFDSLDTGLRDQVYQYFGNPPEPMPLMLIKQALASVSNTAIVPWQDFLGLDGEHRMNVPGVAEGNWRWRFSWDQVQQGLAADIRQMLENSQRLGHTRGVENG